MIRLHSHIHRVWAAGMVTALALVVTGAGCAHYTLGTETTGTTDDRTVAVATISVPASFGVDGARLTRQLVDSLRERGLANAAWRRDKEGHSDVRCVIDGPPTESFAGHHRARMEARCAVQTGETTARIRGVGRHASLADAPGSHGLSAAQSTAVESAASDALAEVAPKIVRVLRDPQPGS